MKKYTLLSLGFGLLLLLIIALANVGFGFFNIVNQIPLGDKIGHFSLFGTMAFLINKALNCRTKEILGKDVLVGSLILIIFVVAEELSQIFLDYRTFDVTDLMYDLVGIYVGGFIAVASNQTFFQTLFRSELD
ncbi:MAG: VanZ family protein [Chloroflexota bacterium]